MPYYSPSRFHPACLPARTWGLPIHPTVLRSRPTRAPLASFTQHTFLLDVGISPNPPGGPCGCLCLPQVSWVQPNLLNSPVLYGLRVLCGVFMLTPVGCGCPDLGLSDKLDSFHLFSLFRI